MRVIGIEAFLAWAYREELPKAEAPGTGADLSAAMFGEGAFGAGGWEAVARQGELMAETVHDGRVNSYGVVPLSAWYGAPPHPDAFVLHQAVGALARIDLDVPDGWAPLADLGLTDAEHADAVARALPRIAMAREGRMRLLLKPAELLRRFAILGGAPSWEADPPKRRFILRNGKPAWFKMISVPGTFGARHPREVDGFNKRAQRPWPGAYRKTELDPDPAFAVVDRAEYEVWHAALGLLVETLNDGRLAAHQVTATTQPARPWERL